MNRRKVGGSYEEKAAMFLRLQGMEILELNYRNRFGEIDIIARNRDENGKSRIVFVEVKYRSSKTCGYALEAVDIHKQRKIVQVAWYYLKMHGYGYNQPVRFDIVTIQDNKIHLYENAFYGYDM